MQASPVAPTAIYLDEVGPLLQWAWHALSKLAGMWVWEAHHMPTHAPLVGVAASAFAACGPQHHVISNGTQRCVVNTDTSRLSARLSGCN